MKKKKLALLAGAMLTLATNALAADLNITEQGSTINYVQMLLSTDSGVNFSSSVSEGGGSIAATLDSKPLNYLYCSDIETVVYVPRDYTNTSTNNNGTIHTNGSALTVYNADKVAYLVDKYGVNGVGDLTKQAALQAAIWTEIYSTGTKQYKLDQTHYGSGSTIVSLYNSYVANANTANTSGYASRATWISPAVLNDGTVYQGLVTSNVPEPSTIVLLGTGLFGLAVFGKRRLIKTA